MRAPRLKHGPMCRVDDASLLDAMTELAPSLRDAAVWRTRSAPRRRRRARLSLRLRLRLSARSTRPAMLGIKTL
jgi:hypothetical protein